MADSTSTKTTGAKIVSSDGRISRRRFLAATTSVAGGMLMAFHIPVLGQSLAGRAVLAEPYQPHDDAGSEINAWLSINADDTITIRVAQAEMGEGVFTAMPMIIAEELEADWRTVRAEYASANRSIKQDRVYQRMATGGSSAVRRSRPYLQQAGAEAREKLIRAAAQTWNVAAADCHADYGRVHHQASGRSINYGAIAALAATLPVTDVKIKGPAEFRLLGIPTRRLDVPAKVDGSAIFGIDVRLPNMVYAAVVHCPVLGGTLRSFRFNSVRDMPGVLQAVRLDNGVAIIAETYWQAKTAVEALPVDWLIGEAGKSSTENMRKEFLATLDEEGAVVLVEGNAMQAMEDSQTSIESEYVVPYLSHNCLEPLNCTVSIEPGRVEVWGGFQDPEAVLQVAAEVLSVSPLDVHVNNCFLGGGFGRRFHTDYVREALTIARYSQRPVQMIWSREEDTRQGRYRPMAAQRFKAGFSMEKKLVAYTNHSVSASIMSDWQPAAIKNGVDPSSIEGLGNMPYAVANKKITHTIKNTHLTSWFWRSVGSSQNVFARECFADEMAEAARQDPLQFRRSLLQGQSKLLNVLNKLEEVSQWGKTMPVGSAQGMALHECFGTFVGQVAEVSLSAQGDLSVDRIVSVVDCGNLVNPMTAEEQIESGVLFGLTAALYGKLTVENGRILEDNFDTQQIVRMRETPLLETHWALSGGDMWGGLGEPGTPCVAPAVCNALYQVTGRRIRSLPIKDYYLQRRRR